MGCPGPAGERVRSAPTVSESDSIQRLVLELKQQFEGGEYDHNLVEDLLERLMSDSHMLTTYAHEVSFLEKLANNMDVPLSTDSDWVEASLRVPTFNLGGMVWDDDEL